MSLPSTTSVYSSLGADPDLGELVEMFVGEMPERIASLIRQYDEGNREELRRTVHQLKGAAGSYGFHAVTPLAASLESSLHEAADEQQIKDELDELLDLCRRLRAGPAAPSA